MSVQQGGFSVGRRTGGEIRLASLAYEFSGNVVADDYPVLPDEHR